MHICAFAQLHIESVDSVWASCKKKKSE